MATPITTIEGVSPGPGELSPIQDAFCETHGLQCGYCTPGMILAAHALLAAIRTPTRERHRRGDLGQYLPLHRLRADRRGNRARRRPHARRQPALGASHDERRPPSLRLHQPPRARRPPLRRRPGPLCRRHRAARHAACRAAAVRTRPRGSSRSTPAALAMPGVHYVLTGVNSPPPRSADERARHAARAALPAGRRHRALCRRMGRGRGRRYARAGRRCRRELESTTSRCRS